MPPTDFVFNHTMPWGDIVQQCICLQSSSLSLSITFSSHQTNQPSSEYNATDLSFLVHHDVVRVPVPDTQNERRDAVPGARLGEGVNRSVVPKAHAQ